MTSISLSHLLNEPIDATKHHGDHPTEVFELLPDFTINQSQSKTIEWH